MVEAWGVPPIAFVEKLIAMRENFVAMKRERVAPEKILLRMRLRETRQTLVPLRTNRAPTRTL
jgi:hypothetical protein